MVAKRALIETSRKRMASRPAPGTPRPSLPSPSPPPPPPRSNGSTLRGPPPLGPPSLTSGASRTEGIQIRYRRPGKSYTRLSAAFSLAKTRLKPRVPFGGMWYERGMPEISRRQFSSALLILGAQSRSVWGASSAGIDQTPRSSLQQHKIPACLAMAATSTKTTYSGAFGKRDSASGIDVNADSLFMIASMTKAITSVAAMQLVEQGKLKLDEPASTYIKELGGLQVLHGFDPGTGKPILKPATKPVTLRTLLTHTSGFCYDTWFADMLQYEKATGVSFPLGTVAPLTPLMFEPGSRWQYGTSADWSGRLVEAVSGMSLEQYFQKNILGPLGMHDTGFLVPAGNLGRM